MNQRQVRIIEAQGVKVETYYEGAGDAHRMIQLYSGDDAKLVIFAVAEELLDRVPPHPHGEPEIIDVILSRDPPRLCVKVAWRLLP